MRPGASRLALLPVLAAAAVAGLAGQQPPFKSGVEVVRITATVRDAEGRLVRKLLREAFEVYEDGERQPISQFTSERVPVSLGVLLDISDSMFGSRITEARAAIDRFLFELLDQSDEYFILAFNHAPNVLTGWTNNPAVVRRALEGIRPSGGTAEYDAVLAALPLFERRTKPRASLLLVTDGADTASDATLSDVRWALLRSDAFAYAIALDPPEPRPINTIVNLQALTELTAGSGGRAEVVRNGADLIAATAAIAEELNSQYVLGYNAPRAPDGKFHSIRVRVTGAGYRVRARSGYLAVPAPRKR